MNMLLNLESPVTTAHRAKLAYIYVRQSTAGQVRQHQESTELQYRLVDRAAAFGWPKERIEVIDDDLGKSGTSSDGRGGFRRLIAEIGLGKAGLVLSLDASRLARNNHDWHQLLELCSLFGVLIADGERVYDPCAARPSSPSTVVPRCSKRPPVRLSAWVTRTPSTIPLTSRWNG